MKGTNKMKPGEQIKRYRNDIILDILELLILNPKGMKQTNLMFDSNTCHTQLKPILEEMKRKDWIHYIEKKLRITRNGIDVFIDLKIAQRRLLSQPKLKSSEVVSK